MKINVAKTQGMTVNNGDNMTVMKVMGKYNKLKGSYIFSPPLTEDYYRCKEEILQVLPSPEKAFNKRRRIYFATRIWKRERNW